MFVCVGLSNDKYLVLSMIRIRCAVVVTLTFTIMGECKLLEKYHISVKTYKTCMPTALKSNQTEIRRMPDLNRVYK